jgi:hypothetical protein
VRAPYRTADGLAKLRQACLVLDVAHIDRIRLMSREPRRFSDQEFALVLRKAMELQDGRDGAHRTAGGLSLEDMKAVARDVGIDPALVDRAVSLLPEDRHSTKDRLTGGPTRYRLEHSAKTPLNEEDVARLLDVVRRETGFHGKVTSEIDGVTWETEGEVSQFHVSLAPRGEGTEVRLSVNRDVAFILTWSFSVAAAAAGAGVTGAIIEPATVLGGLAIMGTLLTGGLAVARTLWGRSSRAVRAKAQRLMEALVREVEEGAGA